VLLQYDPAANDNEISELWLGAFLGRGGPRGHVATSRLLKKLILRADFLLRMEVATEMSLHVLAYNLTRVMTGVKPLLAAIRA
jgi:hypothetical protein